MKINLNKSETKGAFPTDEHFPFQDESARNVALQIVEAHDPDYLVTGSDGMDFYSLSTFDKNPDRIQWDLQSEINQWRAGQREWASAAPRAERVHIPGNHEDRLRRWLWRHPEFAKLDALKIESLLGLEELGLFPTSEDEVVFGDQLVVKHGATVRKYSGYSARAELDNERYIISTLTGHTHRGGVHYATTRRGVVSAHEGFCLCDLNPEYVKDPDWQQGITLFTVSSDMINIEPVPFYRSGDKVHAIWRGQLFKEGV